MAEYDDLKDRDFAETPVKNKGKSKGRKGNVPPKTYVVPDLMNEGTYVDTKVSNTKSGGKGGNGKGWKPRPENATASPEGQNVKYQAPRGGGKSTISELPGQMTGPVPVPKKARPGTGPTPRPKVKKGK